MPTNFPSDQFDLVKMTPFLKIIDSPLNLNILFYITIFNDLTFEELKEKLGNVDNNAIIESLKKMKEVRIVEEYQIEKIIHYKASGVNYQPKVFEEYFDINIEQIKNHLNEEFLYTYRILSLIKSIFGKLVHYICDFYISRIQNPTLDPKTLFDELKYDTSVPHVGFTNKEEYEIYKERFNEFEMSLIKELLTRRKELGIAEKPEIEYMIFNLFIPIRKVLDRKS